jgi:hypothetical protein
MTLKEGRQKDYFLKAINKSFPQLASQYSQIYTGNKWGEPTRQYADPVYKTFNAVAKKYRIPQRVPPSFYSDILNENDKVVVMLEHLDHLLKIGGGKSSLGYAAYAVSQLKQSIRDTDISVIKAINREAQNTVTEILDTGTSIQLEKLLFL